MKTKSVEQLKRKIRELNIKNDRLSRDCLEFRKDNYILKLENKELLRENKLLSVKNQLLESMRNK